MVNRRVAYHQFGEADVLNVEKLEIPQPAPGHVVVKMAGAGLNPIDYKTRRGLGFVASQISDALPWYPGYDLSGTIHSLGEGVSSWKIGDQVLGMIGFPLIGGAYSEYVEVEGEQLCSAPESIELSHAGAVPLAALTAWQALFEAAQLKLGSRILVHAAAGGVGHFAVQFAKAKGCEVIASASKANHEYLKRLGVDQVIDYKTEDVFSVCGPVDFVLDNMGGEIGIKSLTLVKDGGQLVTVPTVTAQQVIDAADSINDRAISVTGLTVHPDTTSLVEIVKMIDAGDVTVNVEQKFSLENAKEAHIELEKGHTRGKLILIP